MWLTIAGYVLSCFAIIVASPMLGLVFFPLTRFVRRFRVVAPAFMAITTAAATGVAVLIFVWLASVMGIRLSYLMFLIPYVLSLQNDFARIARAKRGTTPVALIAGDDYDAGLQVKMEYGYLVGDTAGIFVPVLMLGRLPLA